MICIEIIAGLIRSDSVIASGLSFLSEGDSVRIVNNPLPAIHPLLQNNEAHK